jgi:hypothetical protein
MVPHRPFFIFFIFAILIQIFTLTQTTTAYECQKCPKRDIAVFGISVPPIESDALLDYSDWVYMHLVGDGLFNALFDEDPSRECLNFVEGQMASKGIGSGGTYQHSPGGFPAPAGAIGGADYIIAGQIGVPLLGREYMITVSLEAAESREVVATFSEKYDFSNGGSAYGRALARHFMPLMEKIRDFEKRKRDEVPAVAIDVEEGITITPARHFIKIGQTVKVKYRLEDCDGEPLKGRIFAPFATLGYLDVKEAPQTDDNGELELEFIAGDKSGTAKLRAEFQYVQPFGREDTGGGVGKIQIVNHSVWASVKVHHERHFNQDEEEGRKIVKKNSHGSRTFSVYMYFDPKPFQVNYAKDRPVPVRFSHRLAGFLPGQFVHYASGSSYEALKSYQGLEWSITASYSETAQGGPLELFQKEIDYVTYEIDPKSGTITKVDLPTFKSEYRIIINRTCEKVNNEKHTREDCSSKSDTKGTFTTHFPASKECEEPAVIGPTMVSGMCRIPYESKYTQRTSTYEWEFHRE